MELSLQLIEKAKQERALHLDLGNCGLKELPDTLFELTWLESLGLSDLYIFEEEVNYGQTQNLGEPNQIMVLPTQISQLTALKKLSIGNIQILNKHSRTTISDISNLQECQSLTDITLWNCSITNIAALKNLTKLQTLNLSRTKVSDISDLKKLTKLRTLSLSNTNVTDIDVLKNLTGLQKLYLAGTEVTDIAALKNLTELQTLHLASTEVTDIAALKNLTELQTLYLEGTGITDIAALRNLTKLQNLDLTETKISDISTIKNLTELQQLDLAETQVSNISPLLPLLKKSIQAVSDEFAAFNHQFINLYKTPVPNIVYDLLGDKNNEKLINYLEQITQPDNPPQKLYEAKLMVVGEPGAGKTSLMKKLLDPSYVLPESNDEDSTTGINIEPWSFETPDKNQAFQAHIWDFGGQKRQYMTHQFFLTAHTVYILVDTNDRKEQDNFPYWFKIINLLGRDNTSNQCSPLRIFLNEREHKQGAPVFSFTFDSKLYEQQYPDLPFDHKRFNLNDPVELKAFTHKIQQSLLQLRHIGDPVPTQWISVRQ